MLRIASSAVWLIGIALFVAFWVRSYWRYDFTQSGGITSANGNLYVGRKVAITRYADYTPSPQQLTKNLLGMLSITSVGVTAEPSGGGITLPYWLLLVPILALAAVPWKRFSLRTLLFATTLIAIVLVLAVYAARK
jgi:hypothetical protein